MTTNRKLSPAPSRRATAGRGDCIWHWTRMRSWSSSQAHSALQCLLQHCSPLQPIPGSPNPTWKHPSRSTLPATVRTRCCMCCMCPFRCRVPTGPCCTITVDLADPNHNETCGCCCGFMLTQRKHTANRGLAELQAQHATCLAQDLTLHIDTKNGATLHLLAVKGTSGWQPHTY